MAKVQACELPPDALLPRRRLAGAHALAPAQGMGLDFGSAVVRHAPAGAGPSTGFDFHAWLGFHKLYPRAPQAARARLVRL